MKRLTEATPPGAQTKWPAQRPKGHWRLYAGVAAAVGVLAAVLAVMVLDRGGSSGSASATPGLPRTHDYHSLLVSPTDPDQLVLGTHEGLYVSDDGGRHWRFDDLADSDAMNLARAPGDTVWLAGHEVFKKSVDAGASWTDLRPGGLPSLDIHGFAVDARTPETLYAAIAGQGLYRSRNAGGSFSLVSAQVGGSVMALVSMPDGRLLAGDMDKGLLESRDGGTTWKPTLRGVRMMGLAVNPSDPNRVLATGAGVALSTDGGRNWLAALDLPDGAGPVAWSSSDPEVAYAVGFDRVLYRSDSGGESWRAVDADG